MFFVTFNPYKVNLFFEDLFFSLCEVVMCSNVNKKHKDSVFSVLFSEPKVLRELYSAIEGIEVPQDAVIDINTLSDVLFMKRINDLSFTIDNRIVVLIEHQSTINENIPLRLLMYIARVYEKIIEQEKLYQRKQQKIPTPEFIVLYNGKEEYPDKKELRLSTAFKDITGIKFPENEYPLELIVKVYNISYGRNQEILNKCETLENYSFFIGKVNEYSEKLPLDKAVKTAVEYCIEHDILKEFLMKHGEEAMSVLFWDISMEEYGEIRAEEAYEDGMEDKTKAIARNLLAKSSTFEFISEVTGLSIEQIEKL